MNLPVNTYGEFDYENAFDACSGCKHVFWTFDVGRDGLCEKCQERAS